MVYKTVGGPSGFAQLLQAMISAGDRKVNVQFNCEGDPLPNEEGQQDPSRN